MELFAAIVALLTCLEAFAEDPCPTFVDQIDWQYTLTHPVIHGDQATIPLDFLPRIEEANGNWRPYPVRDLCLIACVWVHRVYANSFQYGVVHVLKEKTDPHLTRLFGLYCKAYYGDKETEINIVKSGHTYTVYVPKQENDSLKRGTGRPPRLG